MRAVPLEPLPGTPPDESPDRLVSNYLVELGLVFTLVVAACAIYLMVYAFAAFFYLAH